jgi:hypothetical protein
MKIYAAILVVGFACSTLASPAAVESQIWENLQKSRTTNVLVTFKKSDTKRVLDRFDSLALATRDARLNALHSLLKDHADTVQANVIQLLETSRKAKGHDLRQLWISTELVVRNVDKETVEQLRRHPDVASLVAEKFLPLEPFETQEREVVQEDAEWGVSAVRAPEVWETGNRAEGVVVGTIGTGVRATHEALKNNFRGQEGNNDYAWYSPSDLSIIPSDSIGLGTHELGVIAGSANGIGVAPGATWITCQGCEFACSTFDLTECGNWIACPTTTSGGSPQCSMAPNVVSNSWGGGASDFFGDIIASWRKVNITSIFAAGVSASTCGSISSPSSNAETIAVGALQTPDRVSPSSGAGPTADGRIKPDIVAPGTNIISASSTSDTGYATLSGSGLGGAHAAGVAALVYKQRANLSADQVRAALACGAQPVIPTGTNCGGVDDSVYPNNSAGDGRVDAVASINCV